MKINTTELVVSAVRRSQYPEDNKPEFLLVGRSNVGKSSFINTITGRKKLARTSSTPGKTRNSSINRTKPIKISMNKTSHSIYNIFCLIKIHFF